MAIGRHRRVGSYTGRHRNSARYTGRHRKLTRDSMFGGVFGRLRPSWTPPGGFPKPGPVGVMPGQPDMFGTFIRFPGSTYKSASARTNRLFGDWT